MKTLRRLLLWAAVTLYVAAADVESRDTTAQLLLTPGQHSEINVYRADDDDVRPYLKFVPPLPTAKVRLEISVAGGAPTEFTAEPATISGGQGFRILSAVPKPSTLPIGPGRSRLRVRVLEAEPPGQTMSVVIGAALGAKTYDLGHGWLYPGLFLVPFYLFTQPVWLLAILLAATIKNRKRARAG